MQRPSLPELIRLYSRVGNTTFGGGYATIAALEGELVSRRHWITPEQFGIAYALSQVTPGTNLLAFCAATGNIAGGFGGAFAAVMALTVPSAVLAVLIMRGFESGRSSPMIVALIGGAVAAVAGMMGATVWRLIRERMGSGAGSAARGILIAGGAFLASWKFQITPVPILAAAMLAGVLWKDAGE